MDEAYRPCYGRARGAVESSRHRIYHQGRAQLRIIFSTAVLNFVCFFCKLHDASKISVETECTEPRCTSADDHVGACHGALMPASATLRKYRKGKKATGTYGKQWTEKWVDKASKEQGWVHPWDGRIHASFNQLEAETGRSSCSKPNMQNLPKVDEVRACFICDPPDAEEPEGYCLVTTDMSGAELRIIAELAHATSWIRAFNLGHDVHSVSTEILEPEKRSEERRVGKEC